MFFQVQYRQPGTLWNVALPPMTQQAAQGYAATVVKLIQPQDVRFVLSATTQKLDIKV